MPAVLNSGEEAQLVQTVEMFEIITQTQPHDYQSLEILKEAYSKLGREADVIGTSKRIAHAYLQLGQLSSAILEYESVLQRCPEDRDVLMALADIEQVAVGYGAPAPAGISEPARSKSDTSRIKVAASAPAASGDDGRQAMEKVFVGGKLISPSDFSHYWPEVGEGDPGRVIEPFIQVVADKGFLPLDKSLKLLLEASRMGYLPLDKYDADIELARSFPRQMCQRWCVAPVDRLSKSVLVATANPFNKQAAAELEKATSHRLIWYLASPPELVKLLKKVFR